MIAQGGTNLTEAAAEHDASVALNEDGADRVVQDDGGKVGIRTAIRVEPCEACTRLAGDCGEVSADDDLAVRLNSQRPDRVVGVWIESIIRALCGAQRWQRGQYHQQKKDLSCRESEPDRL